MVRQKEGKVRLERKIEFRVPEGMYNYLKDFAGEEEADISKIVRAIILVYMDEKAKDKYFLIDKINEMIKHHENELTKLEKLKEEIVSKE